MIIRKLTMKNFKQYRDQAVDFPEGLTGIIGRNGSGKSSLFEAIIMALYGEIPFTKDYLRTSGAGEREPVSVELAFEIEGKDYRVIREYRGKNLTSRGQLYRGNDELLATGTREVNEEVEKLVGMGREPFRRSIFSGQKELDAITELKGSERRSMVRKMIGMEKIDTIQQMVRRDRNTLKNEVSGQERMLLGEKDVEKKKALLGELREKGAALEEETANKEKELEEAEKVYGEAKERSGEQQELYKKYSAAKSGVENLAVKIESLERTIQSGTDRLEELKSEKVEADRLEPREKEYLSARQEKERLDEMQVKHTRIEGLLRQAETLRKEIERLKRESTRTVKEAEKLAGVDDELKKSGEELKRLEKEIEKGNSEINRLNSGIGSVRGLVEERSESIEKITKAGKDSSCPTCLRPLQDAYETTLEKLNADLARYQGEELDRLKAQLKEKEESLADLKKKEKARKEAIDGLKEKASLKKQKEQEQKRINEETARKKKDAGNLETEIQKSGTVDYDEKKHREVKSALDELQKIHDRYTALREKIKGIPKLIEELEASSENREKLQEEKNEKDVALRTIPYSEESHNDAEKAREDAEKKRDTIRDNLSEKKETFQEITHRIQITKRELEEDAGRREEVERNRGEFQALEKLDTFLDEFKNVILARVRPRVSRYASEFFEELTGGLYEAITVDDDFGFMISDQGEEYPIERFSGGEKDLANLCLRLAISRVISELEGGGAMGFLGFDEIFGSQDDERRMEILGAFHKLQEKYRQIFIITHLSDVKEEFPRIMEVRRRGGSSQVEWL